MNKNYQLDDIDKKILNLLQEDSRMPFLEIARECGISGAAIHQRFQKLLNDGLVIGSEILVDPIKIGYSTCAFIGIFLEKASMFSEVVEELKKIPEVVECHYTTGNYSIFIKVFTHDNNHLKEVLADKLQSIKGISRTETLISLEQSFKRYLPVT
jgi:Lrp/AsnC family transcriptional regulator for asnA, asnC and gidA